MTQGVLFLVLTALLLSHSADAFIPVFVRGSPVSKFCKTANSKRLCTRMVAGATSLHEASANAIKATLTLAKKIQSMSAAIIPAMADIPAVSKDLIVQTCQESFQDAVDDLNLSLQALDANDQGALMTHLSATLYSDCGDVLNEFSVSFPLQTIVKLYARYLDNALAVVTQQ